MTRRGPDLKPYCGERQVGQSCALPSASLLLSLGYRAEVQIVQAMGLRVPFLFFRREMPAVAQADSWKGLGAGEAKGCGKNRNPRGTISARPVGKEVPAYGQVFC